MTTVMMETEYCEKGLVEHVRRVSPPPFLLKTFMLVEDPATDDVISWNADGTAFVVWQPTEFARDLLPKLFKHSNFSSFIRQLNTYGFRKVATTRWEFCNDMFRKGGKEVLSEIRRRKSWPNKQQVPVTQTVLAPASIFKDQADDQLDNHKPNCSNSSSSGFTNLVDENKRLKKENGVLNSELSNMKNKCKELFDLVAMYAKFTNLEKEDVDEDKEEDENDRGAKIFGVRLQEERARKRK